jgi:hypothetical protein
METNRRPRNGNGGGVVNIVRMVLRTRSRLLAPLVAAGLALLVVLTGAQGVDLAAATYRVELFARSGLTVWDSQWYGGHWTFDYSVLFAPIGWLAGIPVMAVVCVALAAWAFDRLAVARFGRAGRAGAVVFAIGTVVQVSIGQEPYLLGETLGLVALLAARRGFWPLSVPLAIATSLASPLAGGFLAIVAVAWVIGSWPRRRYAAVVVLAAAGLPVLLVEVLFPGQGPDPFAALNFVGMLAGLAGIGVVVALRRDRMLVAGVALYALALVVTFAVPSSIGANITRLGISFGVALVVILAWDERRGRTLLIAAAIPVALAQWVPARQALLGEGNASMKAAYYQPLLRFLGHADRPLGRVEVVPTAFHTEAEFVSPSFPLARGWERQLDIADNALFYEPGRLNDTSYRSWLLANGVRFVALPDVALDYAAKAEAQLVRAGVPGLRLVWRNANWRVYGVIGAPGLVSGPARLVSSNGADVRLRATAPGVIVVRERYVDAWHVASGAAVISRAGGGWLRVRVRRAGPVELRVVL